VDADSETAIDGMACVGLETRSVTILRATVRSADDYLRHHKKAVVIRLDRALALWALHDDVRAASEFRWLGTYLGDKRFFRIADRASARASRTMRVRGLAQP